MVKDEVVEDYIEEEVAVDCLELEMMKGKNLLVGVALVADYSYYLEVVDREVDYMELDPEKEVDVDYMNLEVVVAGYMDLVVEVAFADYKVLEVVVVDYMILVEVVVVDYMDLEVVVAVDYMALEVVVVDYTVLANYVVIGSCDSIYRQQP